TGQFSGMKCGGKDVGEKQEIIFPLVARLPRQLQTIEVRVGHQDKFSLTSLIRSHPCVAIGRMRFLRIHGETSFRVAAMTIEAEAASNIEGQDNAVSLFDAFHGPAHFFDYPHDLVTYNRSRVKRSTAVIHMKIAAADSTGGDS